MDSFIGLLREYPALAIFLTLGLGFFLGKVRIGSFSLGSVTSVLLVGVLVGQLEIPISGPMKMFFFMMFLFSIGYSVGPNFFKSLKGEGARQAIFAVCLSMTIFAVTLSLAWFFGYTKGETVGLFSGSQTCSSLLGVGSEAIERLGLPEADLKKELNIIPVCYAVTYIFGTLGTVIILGTLGPKLLGGLETVRRKTQELEKQLDKTGSNSDPAYVNALRTAEYRAYRADGILFYGPQTARDIEVYLRQNGLEVYVDRVRHDDAIFAPRHDDLIYPGDSVVICGRHEFIVSVEPLVGHEVADDALLSYPLQRVGVVVVDKNFTGRTLSELRNTKFMRGVVIRDASRGGEPLEVTKETVFCKGDRLTIVGREVQVRNAASRIGHLDRPSVVSDLMFLGLSIFVGGLFGALSVRIGNIPISFGTSGGALISGLFFGWLRSRRPTYGNIAPGALWLMNNMGLNVFIAVVGLEAAPSFISGIKAVGPMLFAAGAISTSVPLLIGMWLGHKVFKFNPAITLGCCAGTRTCTASLGAVQEALGSTLPAIGYTTTYAVSNILLVIWGLTTVLII